MKFLFTWVRKPQEISSPAVFHCLVKALHIHTVSFVCLRTHCQQCIVSVEKWQGGGELWRHEWWYKQLKDWISDQGLHGSNLIPAMRK